MAGYNLPNLDNGYSPIQVDSTPGSFSNVYNQSSYANRPTGQFQNENNYNVEEKSNLMGPSNGNDPTSDALSSRAKQLYNSNVHRIMQQGAPQAVQRQTQLQAQDVNNRAALYSNAQSRDTLNFQQISFQREAAITQEATRMQLLGQIFQGVAVVGGMFAAKGLYNARHPVAGVEGTGGFQMGSNQTGFDPNATGSFQSSPVGGLSYNSPHFGSIGG